MAETVQMEKRAIKVRKEIPEIRAKKVTRVKKAMTDKTDKMAPTESMDRALMILHPNIINLTQKHHKLAVIGAKQNQLGNPISIYGHEIKSLILIRVKLNIRHLY